MLIVTLSMKLLKMPFTSCKYMTVCLTMDMVLSIDHIDGHCFSNKVPANTEEIKVIMGVMGQVYHLKLFVVVIKHMSSV